MDLISLVFRKSWGTDWGQDAESSCAQGDCVRGRERLAKVKGCSASNAKSGALTLNQRCPDSRAGRGGF